MFFFDPTMDNLLIVQMILIFIKKDVYSMNLEKIIYQFSHNHFDLYSKPDICI